MASPNPAPASESVRGSDTTLELPDVAFFWYESLHPERPLSSSHLTSIWTNKWFAKGEKTARVDDECRRFESLLDRVSPSEETPSVITQMAYIILFDQIPRNIFRGTARAYAYDPRSYALASRLFADQGGFSRLPFHMKCTVLICLVHSEIAADQMAVFDYVHSDALPQGDDIVGTLRAIANSHRERILLFGRFPERNKLLGRESTAAEAAFMAGIYAK